jgi:hypothetical protein
VEVHDAVAEPALVQQLEADPYVVRQSPRAAADNDRREEQVTLVDEAGLDRLRGEM